MRCAEGIVSMIETLDPRIVKAYINALGQIPENSGEDGTNRVLEQLKKDILDKGSKGIEGNNIKRFLDNAHYVMHSSPGSTPGGH
jgi:hypothetical protein